MIFLQLSTPLRSSLSRFLSFASHGNGAPRFVCGLHLAPVHAGLRSMLKKTKAAASKRATWHMTLVGLIGGVKTVEKLTEEGATTVVTFWVNNSTRVKRGGKEVRVDLPSLYCRVLADTETGRLALESRDRKWTRVRVGGWMQPLGEIEENENGYLESESLYLSVDSSEGLEVLGTSDDA